LLRQGDTMEARFAPRLLAVSTLTLLTSPLRLCERLRYGGALRLAALHPSPIFIIGHWRSGTTFLHQLMCRDRNLGYVSTFQAMAPGFSLIGERTVKPLMAKVIGRLYPTRLIDAIPLSLDAPQEEDYAVAATSLYSYLHAFTFPKRAADFFSRYVLLDGLSDETLARWKETYRAVLAKATVAAGGRRLVLKNPAHTGRIGAVLELFPDAKFIHVCRSPYEVFLSTRFLYDTVLPRSQLQSVSPDAVEANILRFYAALMQRYLADRALIPAGNLVEVRFEDLEADPLTEMRRVYEGLGLPGYAEAEPAFEAHVASVAGYRRNHYDLTDEVITQVNQHWGFALDEWGYPRLEPSPALRLAACEDVRA
ncbi:MAG: sulfotransferase, partial [Anaerolineales bacterium]|nr:sulfotransferase [Anaerolineales bacterium]